MRRKVGLAAGLAVGAAWMAFGAMPAFASFHLWQINEVYSNAAGNVQFIEFILPSAFDDESHTSFANISDSAKSNAFALGHDLPSVPVVGQHFLIGTAAYAALSGVPAPDFTMPNNFLSTAADTLTYSGGVDSLQWSTLPTDGTHSINHSGAQAINSPTNFAGQTGTVPEPGMLGIVGAAGLLALFRRRRANAM